MSAHMKAHHTDPAQAYCHVVVMMPAAKKMSYHINLSHMKELETFLQKYSDNDDAPVAWNVLAKERLKRHKKAGLVLRGMRYREDMSQKALAVKSRVSQTEISKIENGKRPAGEKVAKRLAAALKIDYRLLTES